MHPSCPAGCLASGGQGLPGREFSSWVSSPRETLGPGVRSSASCACCPPPSQLWIRPVWGVAFILVSEIGIGRRGETQF